MTSPRCTCGPSILDPECPVREHQEELERTADPFAYEERMVAVEQIRRMNEPSGEALAELLATPPISKLRACSEFMVEPGEPTDGGCE